ncbi:MAG: bacillithiol biosynthesis BshC, partial [Calditrichaeota bacterium]|nr:bacillithiol biosynthesis BshC [Calditrichota bacterium]
LFGQRSAALAEAGFPAQISHRENQSLLFWVDENQRRMRLDLDGRGGFTANHPDGPRPLSEAELLAVLDTDGQMLSPNVALRPLLQDSLLPTAAYIGGPAEVAYFSQIAALYSHFGMHMPVIMPRHRLTLVESKIQRVLDKLNLSVGQILEGDAGFVADYLRRHAGQELAEGIRSAETQIQDALQKVENLLQEADPTLLNGLEKTRGNIEGSFGKLREKITRSLEQQNGTLVAQLERVQRFLTPEGVPQERLIGAFYFLVKYGPGLLTDLADVLTDDVVRHHVVAL